MSEFFSIWVFADMPTQTNVKILFLTKKANELPQKVFTYQHKPPHYHQHHIDNRYSHTVLHKNYTC